MARPRLQWLALGLALATLVLGLRFGTFAASGADSYGYVSQADLWLRGTLIIAEPLGGEAPWNNANFALAPLGYHPGDRGGTMVPTYSPGLPMVMALFKAVAGADAVYWVVPLLGALAVWLTFVLGARMGGEDTGLLAALSLLVSPAFLYQLMWPMSDVPVTAWWLLSVVLALGPTRRYAVGAGVAVAAAVLTRPNLVPLALPVGVLMLARSASWRERAARGAVFALAALPGPVAIAIINNHLFGSPLASGYGPIGLLYKSEHLAANLEQFPRWLITTQSPFLLLALVAPALLHWRRLERPRDLATFGLAFSAVVFLLYVWYIPFGDWTFLRFLLPAYPMMLVSAAAAFASIAPPAGRSRTLAFVAVAAILAGWGCWQGRIAFEVRGLESRYIEAGRLARGLPDNAAVLTNQHSGSLRFYGGGNRITLRFEWLDPADYTEAIAYLHSIGRPVFAVLDDFERDLVRARYGQTADISWLDQPPIVVAAGRVYFYAIP
jgi:hypothetical protein